MSDKIKKLITECKSTIDAIDGAYFRLGDDIDRFLLEDEDVNIEGWLERIREDLDSIFLEIQQAECLSKKKGNKS